MTKQQRLDEARRPPLSNQAVDGPLSNERPSAALRKRSDAGAPDPTPSHDCTHSLAYSRNPFFLLPDFWRHTLVKNWRVSVNLARAVRISGKEVSRGGSWSKKKGLRG